MVVSARYIPSTKAAKGAEMNTGGRGLRDFAVSVTRSSSTLSSPLYPVVFEIKALSVLSVHPEGAKLCKAPPMHEFWRCLFNAP
jgi:hypothetical protein